MQLSEGKNGGGQRLRASLKNETRLRDKIEKLQEDLNEKLREYSIFMTGAHIMYNNIRRIILTHK
jgi:hypothetical protein